MKCRLFSQAAKRLVSTSFRCPDWTNQDKLLRQQLVTRAITSLCTELKSKMTSFRMIAVSIRKKQDMNYTKFKPRPQNEACHNNHNFVYFTFNTEHFQNTFQNSFYCGAQRTWNTLPCHLRSIDCSVCHFKKELFNYSLYLTKSVYDVNPPPPRPIRVCVSIATLLGHWPACSIECVVDSFINVCPYSVYYFCFYCFHKCSVIIVSISFINILIFCYFLDLVIWLALWVLVSVPGLLPKFVNE